ncbi:Peptidyl-prolyl cis-trans isomerase-like protein 6 [Elsinoe fawcettii]|nr:Peptidyl-prolyl cis-trans isomerase-like protein 6 [Elsinoe fawcettii]
MASTYNVEPPPTGKVLLKTTNGDIVLELFAKQVPLASRNFIQHCLDGYYDNTIFHRLVPGFIIQGGDPTGLGTGGQSAINDGAPFEDEFHSRLRFNRRGLLGMANTGPNDNTSQFFLTLDKTPELQGKNTMFGRVEGDTIYNLMKMAESELAEEGGDRPLYPPKVLGSEVLVNPFEGMVARQKIAQATKEGAKTKKKRKAAKGGLSFGDDEDVAQPAVKKAKVNPDFKVEEQTEQEVRPQKIKPAAPAVPEKRTRRRSTSSVSSDEELEEKKASPKVEAKLNKQAGADLSPEPEQVKKTMSALERTNAEIAALKASMKRNTAAPEAKLEKKKSALEAMIPTTSTRGRKRGKAGDDDSALKLFNSFKKRLDNTVSIQEDRAKVDKQTDGHDAGAKGNAVDEEEKLCDLHFIVNCQSCKAWDDEDGNKEADDDDDPNWMSHQLSFAKDTLGKDLEWKRKMEEFEVIDPREKTKDIASDKRKHRDEGKRDRGRHGNSAKIPSSRR